MSDDEWDDGDALQAPKYLFAAIVVKDYIPPTYKHLTLELDNLVYVFSTSVPGHPGFYEGEYKGVMGIFPGEHVKKIQEKKQLPAWAAALAQKTGRGQNKFSIKKNMCIVGRKRRFGAEYASFSRPPRPLSAIARHTQASAPPKRAVAGRLTFGTTTVGSAPDNLLLELEEPIQEGLRRRGAAGDINIDRNNPVTAPDHRIGVVVVAPAVSAAPHRHHVARLRHLIVHLPDAGAILFVSVPATIITSDCRGLARKTIPKRSMSYLAPAVCIISTAQQARPNVMGHMELDRPQLKILSTVDRTYSPALDGGACFPTYVVGRATMPVVARFTISLTLFPAAMVPLPVRPASPRLFTSPPTAPCSL
eukprot:CAMPEP_0119124720 /NCGR_PEP_ID=MMETSP1310-20130426/4258_1 /TAXON_ID=464262 /ORGANISM="Genus nov. species nov., Strain RCC2339" /LENGTH=362 /DNA_ID=CAMNT_0007114713 /DNA_START=66 /DNA_END=1153 /DNA_ORIENTATION=-